MIKKKLAIFDLTDCEGCELEILPTDKISNDFLDNNFEIINWRLVTDKSNSGPFDIAIIEGSPVKKSEIEELKIIRQKSKFLIALGACACLGGIPSISQEKDRTKLLSYVYGKNYRSRYINPKPISEYVNIDYKINGCPANPKEISQALIDLSHDKVPNTKTHSVCFECKAKDNNCLFTEGKPCLGPITKEGCAAACPSHGIACYGCWGHLEGSNIEAMIIALKKQGRKKDEIKKILNLFLENEKEYKKYLKN